MSTTNDAAENARDRAIGLALKASLSQKVRNGDRASATAKLGSSSKHERKAAAVDLAGIDRADLRDNAQVIALGDVLGKEWTESAQTTIDFVTTLISGTDDEERALEIIDKFGSSKQNDGSVKLPLARQLIRDYHSALGKVDEDLRREQMAEGDRVLADAAKRRRTP